MAKALFVAVLVLGLSSSVLAAEIEDCAENDDLGEFTKVEVSDCKDEDSKCPLARGHNVTISINFKAKKPATHVSQIVHGVMAGMAVPFPLDNPDACKDSGLTCPLTEGDHSYHYTMFVKTVYPKVSVKVKWELQNENKQQIICALIPAFLK